MVKTRQKKRQIKVYTGRAGRRLRWTGKEKKNCVFSKLLFVLSLTSHVINHFEKMDIFFVYLAISDEDSFLCHSNNKYKKISQIDRQP